MRPRGESVAAEPVGLSLQSLDYDRCENAIYRKELREKYENAKVCDIGEPAMRNTHHG
jgi:hypothetical protein